MHFKQAIKDRNYGYLIWAILAAITIFAIFVPIKPDMPTSGLDPSWKFALNYAKSAGLGFGSDLIFTFGPYASVYTGEYHPDTDKLMLLSSSFLAVFYLIALYQIGPRAGIFWLAIFLYVAAAFMYLKDTLLTSYPLLLSVVFISNLRPKNTNRTSSPKIALAILTAPLGLLPLIKGSLLLMPVAFIPLYFAFLWKLEKPGAAIIAILAPTLTLLAAWALAGENLVDLPIYFRSMTDVISGYTDAMSTKGEIIQVVVFLAAATGIFSFLAKTPEFTPGERIFLIASVAAFLFVSFKGGFVRHDGHALMAANGLLATAALLALITATSSHFLLFFLGVAASTFFIDWRIIHSTNGILFANVARPYQKLISGLKIRSRGPEALSKEYNQHLDAIRSEITIAPMSGSSDIYAYNQSYLLASKNRWAPRPVFQSYAAFTPWLIEQNNSHILNAPTDNIVFRVETIDNRIPSLDDGLSWPTILNSYVPRKFADNYSYLARSEDVSYPRLETIRTASYRTGEIVQLPETDKVLFAKITLKKTLAGKIASFLYKLPPIDASFTLTGGDERTFRLIPGMAETGFVISPLVESTTEFSLLYGDRSNLDDKKVASVRVVARGLGHFFWKSNYDLEISSIDMTRAEAQQPISPFTPVRFSMPEGVERASDENCQSAIDAINGRPASQVAPVITLLTLSGWLMVPKEVEAVPQQVFVTVTDEQGRTAYILADRTQRPDVKKFFGRESMPEPGFTASANLRDLTGNLTLGLARVRDGKLHACRNTLVKLVRVDQPVNNLTELNYVGTTPEKNTDACEGNIDTINGKSPSPTLNIADKTLSITGWTTLSGRDGHIPDAVFVTFTNSDGKRFYAKAHKVTRGDVAAHFGRPPPFEAGFSVTIPTARLGNQLRVGVSRLNDGTLETCSTLTLPVSIRH